LFKDNVVTIDPAGSAIKRQTWSAGGASFVIYRDLGLLNTKMVDEHKETLKSLKGTNVALINYKGKDVVHVYSPSGNEYK